MAIKKNIVNEDFEYGVDSRYLSDKERKSESIALMQARLERMKHLPTEQTKRAKLMQLKLKMENYLKDPLDDNRNFFMVFLERYIDTIYSKRNNFARDIDITPVYLSQIINNHREPNEEFILKLMVHSKMAFKEVGSFNEKIWYLVYYHEKIGNIMSSQDQWRPEIEKHVKFTELVDK